MAKTFTAVIFDLDGTLMDTSGEIATALERTFVELQLPVVPKAVVETLIGRGVPMLIERALAKVGASHRQPAEVVHHFERHYERTVGTASVLYPGVVEALRLLRQRRMPMSVVTNKPRLFTEKLLAGLGIADFFSAVVAGDDGIRRKPHGDMLLAACERMGSKPGATLMLGDSDNDITAAREAGCHVWCVPYGYNEGRAPDTLRCDRLVATLEEAAREISS
ncbi:MAG TPA: phosphoglycolate phosphatase [Usitatibacter sp.]|nr:phosphoglycolate phosphatase [Usitatibacter sp.]